jgi:ATP-dependent Clp protease ATP-binding subunit ClpC
MGKASFRVYFVDHGEGQKTGSLLRQWDNFFDKPPPAAFGASETDVFAQLELQLAELEAEKAGEIERYLWEDSFASREVKITIHPRSSVAKRAVIGKKEIPLVITYAYTKLKGGGYKVMVPRFGGWFILEDLSLAPDVLKNAVSNWLLGEVPRWVYDFRHDGDEYVREWAPALLQRKEPPPKANDADAPPQTLAQVAEELVDRAAKDKLGLIVGESPQLNAFQASMRRTPPASLLVVGPPGVGKTAFVRRCARLFATWRKDATRHAPRLWATSADKIIAGMVYLGQWQERCLSILRELAGEGDYLYVDRLTSILKPQPDGASIADFLEPAMAAGDISVMAECTPSELERLQRVRPRLIGHFALVRIPEPPHPQVIELAQMYAHKKGGVSLHPAAIKRAVQHLAAFQPGTAFPGKIVRFIDWIAHENAGKKTKQQLYPRDVSEAYARFTGLSLRLISDDYPADAAALAQALRDRVIGQDEACDACGRMLARFKAQMNDPDRPLGALLFVGPTGVGKTELAKQIARTTFGDEKRMIRLDMSEYMLRGSAQRMLDVSPGTTSLAALVHKEPLSLVLFDEIEKAHPEVFDVLLAVLGEGRMTDASGRLVDFRGTILVMTSNLGVTETRPVGFGEGAAGDYLRAVRAHFRPEMFNRIDHVLPFRALTRDDVVKIVDLELAALGARTGFARRGVKLRVSPAARAWLAEHGYHPTRGARPLKRLVEERVMTPIAARLAADATLRDCVAEVVAHGETARAPLSVVLQ